MEQSIATRVSDILARIRGIHIGDRRVIVPAGVVTVLYILFGNPVTAVRGNYNAWLALGRGGVSPSLSGYLLNNVGALLHLHRRDMTSIEEYENTGHLGRYDQERMRSYLPPDFDLEPRKSRPFVSRWFIPQRQARPGSSEEIRKAQLEDLHAIIDANSHVIEYRESVLEDGGPAIWVKDLAVLPIETKWHNGEIVHIHIRADGSYHVNLSLPDAKLVVGSCWGQRHLLSGGPILPSSLGYTLIYAPRTLDDVQTTGQIIRASLRYSTGTKIV